mgnify:CR=1 FL=1
MNPMANAALGVRTADGSIVPLLDFRLAADNRLVFTTTADGQRRAVSLNPLVKHGQQYKREES